MNPKDLMIHVERIVRPVRAQRPNAPTLPRLAGGLAPRVLPRRVPRPVKVAPIVSVCFNNRSTSSENAMQRSHLVLLIVSLHLAACSEMCALPATTPIARIPLARDGDAIIAKILASPLPDRDPTRNNDPAYMKAYEAEFRETCLKNAALQLELSQRFPNHPKAMWWMRFRWNNLRN